eukprot:Gb_38543 [translate_table: standard]
MRNICGLQSMPVFSVAVLWDLRARRPQLKPIAWNKLRSRNELFSSWVVGSEQCQWASKQVACRARRRMIVDDDDDEEEYTENSVCAKLEAYTQTSRSEALLVHALVDDKEDQVLVFKGFSSSLMRETSPDPSKPVLPSRAIIKSIDRIRGPFNPSKIDYIQKDLSWEEFQVFLEAI